MIKRQRSVWVCTRSVVATAAVALLLMGGCPLLLPGFRVPNLESAQALADVQATAWDANARLIGITSVWVDEDGLAEEAADSPGWGFQYVNEAGTQQLGITVQTNGTVGLDDPIDLTTPVTRTLSAHTDDDIEAYIDVAQAELLRGPKASLLAEGRLDVVVLIGFNQEDGSEDATVLFHEEDDQGTNWSEFDWTQLFATADAYVFMDTATLTVETTSWEMNFARAFRLATARNGDFNRLVGIMAVWVSEEGRLDEPVDEPGWGFQFVNADGTKRIGITIESDGTAIVSPEETLPTPQLETLTAHVEDDIEDYISVAKAEIAAAPPEDLPTTGTVDIAVVIGFNQVDNSEDVVVLFHDEGDQATDWANIDWFQLFQDAETYVFLDVTTGAVENISWD